MDKFWMLGTVGVVAMFTIIMMPDEVLMVADAIYSIPPTPAWSGIGIANNQTFPNSSQSFITAQNYSDNFYIVSDGSILINITEYDP